MITKKRKTQNNKSCVGMIVFDPRRPCNQGIINSCKILGPHFFQKPQNMARMAITKGLIELAAEKQIDIPLKWPKAQSA